MDLFFLNKLMPICKTGKTANKVLKEEILANFNPAAATEVALTFRLKALKRRKAIIASTTKAIKTISQEIINTNPSE